MVVSLSLQVMRKAFFTGIWGFSLGAMVTVSVSGQSVLSADRMTVTQQDTITVAEIPREKAPATFGQTAPGTYGETAPGAADLNNSIPGTGDAVKRIWNEIENDPTADQHILSKAITPWSFSSQLGTSYMFSPYFGSAMNMYAAPQLNYAATGRLAFHAGVSVGRTVPFTRAIDEETPVNAGMTNMSTYVAASYRLSENLVVHGAGTKSVVLVPVDGKLQTMNFNDLSIGATYDFGNFSIGATIHRSDAPGYMSPFGGGSNMYGAPLFW